MTRLLVPFPPFPYPPCLYIAPSLFLSFLRSIVFGMVMVMMEMAKTGDVEP